MHSDFEDLVTHNSSEIFRNVPPEGQSAVRKLISAIEGFYGSDGVYPLSEFSFCVVDSDLLIFDRNSVYIFSVSLDIFSDKELKWILSNLNIFDPNAGEIEITTPVVYFTVLRDDEYLAWRVPSSTPVLLGSLLHRVIDDNADYMVDCTTLVNHKFTLKDSYYSIKSMDFIFGDVGQAFELKLDDNTKIVGDSGYLSIVQDNITGDVEDPMGEVNLLIDGVWAESFFVDSKIKWECTDEVKKLTFDSEIVLDGFDASTLPEDFSFTGVFSIDSTNGLVFYPRKDNLIISDKELEEIDNYIWRLLV